MTTYRYPRRANVAIRAFTAASTLALAAACTDDAPVAPARALEPLLSANARGDGKPALGKIAFARGTDELDRSIFIMNGDGSGVERITNGESDHSPAWAPDYRTLAFVRSDINQYPVIMKYTLARSRLEPLATPGGGAVNGLRWSPDGTALAFEMYAEGHTDIYVLAADGTNLRRLTTDPGMDRHPTWSPDGSRIAFVSDRSAHEEIYVMSADGTNQAPVTDCYVAFQLGCRSPSWSPISGDERIVFTMSAVGGASEIRVIEADGSNPTTLLAKSATSDKRPTWSRDGTRIVFASAMNGGAGDIFSMNASGGGLRQLTATEAVELQPAWSR